MTDELPRSTALGMDREVLDVPDDFDSPLPDDVLTDFEQHTRHARLVVDAGNTRTSRAT